jgi:hypothetical protein
VVFFTSLKKIIKGLSRWLLPSICSSPFKGDGDVVFLGLPSSSRVTALVTVGSISVCLDTVTFLHPLRKGNPRKPMLVEGSLILAAPGGLGSQFLINESGDPV